MKCGDHKRYKGKAAPRANCRACRAIWARSPDRHYNTMCGYSVGDPPRSMMVGTILRYTWGHGQTNIEFFQVTRRTKASVWIKPLEREKIRERGMCGIFAPIPEAHNDGLVARKLIQQGAREYVVMDYGFAWPVNAEDVHFASWWN